MMTANLRQTYNYPRADSMGWQTRYAQIGPWMSANRVVPDIIGLQEVTGWWWCPTNPSAHKDYESLAFLMRSIENNTGVRYRIAYFLVDFHFGESTVGIIEGASTAGGCQTMNGNAMLYNPDTIEHIAESGPGINHDSTDTRIALRRTLPCCDLRASDTWVCSRIDGTPDNEKCSNNPSGLAWSVATAGSGGVLARFRHRNGTRAFNVYNAHWALGADDYDHSRIEARSLVAQMEAQFGSADRWTPPFFMGDFNVRESMPSMVWPDQFVNMTPDEGIDAIYQGNFLVFASHTVARQAASGIACDQNGIKLSDHCFPWVRLTITERE